MDNEFRRVIDRLLDRLDRLTVAVEKLGEEPESMELKMEISPPVCPHCGAFNPTVVVPEGGDGPLMDCVLKAVCRNCDNLILAVPIQWDMLPDYETYERYVHERMEIQDAGRRTNNSD